MLRSLKDLEHYKVHATDGDLGSVVDFLFDDERWTVRYLVVETGSPFFLAERQVLISPMSFREADWTHQRFHVALTREKVRDSPGVELDQPVSRQHERDYYRYYGYPCYWGCPGIWGLGGYPRMLSAKNWTDEPEREADELPGDTHLRSGAEVRGYHVEGSDDAIGHLADFIVDDESWEVRYLVIDTSNWGLGKKVLVAPHWASKISWADRKVHLDLSRDAIENSPPWDPAAAVNREYEARLYDYHGRPVYWSGDVSLTDPPPRPESHTG